jgi:hypothetical protein
MINRKIHTLSKDKNKQDKRNCSNCFYLDQFKICAKGIEHTVYKEYSCCPQYENRTFKLFSDSMEAFSRLFLPCIILIMVGIVWRILNY